ncbi:CMRF35-like molecule 5 isoform X2 [Lepisosteus oculatus]|uniref:CMRF35-like molecule 5 isoform X2 n=1 Tax=Lepisosteus oculatus TaxID=7918 RepID=UPI000740335F|nr:PREDICTED: CMRF35-like molecule 3 isoform X2 [Lepisosteus oculatus]
MQWEMRATVSTVCLLTVLGCVMSAERRVSGSEGGSVEIECNYPDGYQYKKKYWCRHPCGNKDVLIKTGKTDTVVSVGRFSLYDNVSFRTFTVTMSRLTLQDTGVYYCGLEQWGTDRLSEIHLRVRKHTQAMTVSTLSTSMPVTVLMDITKTAAMDSSTQSAGGSNATSLVPGDQINQDSKGQFIVLGVSLAVVVCIFVLAAVVLYIRRPGKTLAPLAENRSRKQGETGGNKTLAESNMNNLMSEYQDATMEEEGGFEEEEGDKEVA